jgi:hypothetical protein
MKLEFLNTISKNSQIPNLVKIRPVGAGLIHADGQTSGHDEANRRFSQFCAIPQIALKCVRFGVLAAVSGL